MVCEVPRLRLETLPTITGPLRRRTRPIYAPRGPLMPAFYPVSFPHTFIKAADLQTGQARWLFLFTIDLEMRCGAFDTRKTHSQNQSEEGLGNPRHQRIYFYRKVDYLWI